MFGFFKFTEICIFKLIFLLIFLLFNTALAGQESDRVKGTILDISGTSFIIELENNIKKDLSISEKTLCVRDNKKVSLEDFIIGDVVYCFILEKDELLALIDLSSTESLSSADDSNLLWVNEFERIFYGEKLTLKGTVKEIVKDERLIKVFTDSGNSEVLYVMNDPVLFDREKNYEIVDFSWDKFSQGLPLEATGYFKKGNPLKVFYIELGNISEVNSISSIEKLLDSYSGVISFLQAENQIVEVEDSQKQRLKFKITRDTVIFDWEVGEEGSFENLSLGQEVKVESIFSPDTVGEAVILEIGDPELYY